MSIEGHLVELERRHEAIEREIKSYLASPATSSEEVSELKRRKLQLKDEITRIQRDRANRKIN
ncbi:YdcH family protein [Pseudochelatococcus sp. G4_1912]|uniref:YdcH family protein n=1 Tax=Pseudochelatococcus sp. G4_1912 TaxID=3114288 RepID=UPI0039C65947